MAALLLPAAATALAAGAYLNAKLSIGIDLQQLSYDREWGKRLGKRIQALGDIPTLYGMFDMVDPMIDALWFEGTTWTYGELKKEINKFAAFLSAKGIVSKDIVAVFTTNSPEMIITILALSKIGAVSGLINTNLRDDTLRHCLNVAHATAIISTPDLSEFINEPLQHFSVKLISFPNSSRLEKSSVIYVDLQTLPVPAVTPAAKSALEDLSVLVYTSGTTGKPKACAIRNQFMTIVSNPLAHDVRHGKKFFPLRTYSPLPLFHGTALFTGLCYILGNCGTLCLARKFSASRFWKDCHDSRATRVLYVGELCRYLLAAPPSPYDRDHNVIVANGNGLRGEIWEKFRERFGVPEIREFYRSTEGLGKHDNFGKSAAGAGKLGFAGPLRRWLEEDTFLIKIDPLTEEVYLDPKTGFCVKVGAGEAGECIGRVKNRGFLTEYLGNSAATEGKILKDVFAKGDSYQRMGDMLIRDSVGWFQFYDRMGDTFRWKGENVSAGEIRDHIAKLPGVQDAVVYGVKLASYDGQAGAASITLESEADDEFMSHFYKGLKKTGLPSYAIPRLVRITKEIEANATFKKSKVDIMKKSWGGNTPGDSDKLYWLNGYRYEKLDETSWSAIESGRAKL